MVLPNLHPAVIHLPLVLVPMAWVLDLATLRRPQWSQASLGLWILAGLGTGAAYVAGGWAVDSLLDVPATSQPAIGSHADMAWWTVLFMLATVLGRVSIAGASATLRLLPLFGGVLVIGSLFLTAERGGSLVYEHGLGVARVECPVPETRPPHVSGQLSLLDVDGTLTWTPYPGEGALLGVTEAPSTDQLVLNVDGEATLLLPPTFNDVQINAWIDRGQFQGKLYLLHHLQPDQGGAFVVSESQAQLIELGPDASVLQSVGLIPPAKAAFSVSAAGEHLKGMINGELVAHGHTSTQPPGHVGLRFVGRGKPVVEKVEVIRLTPHP